MNQIDMLANKKALVVLSGGQDSTTCLGLAKQQYEEVHTITFNYGQRHSIEINSAEKVAEIYKVDSHEVIDLPQNILAGTSFLTNLDAEVEEFETFDMMQHHSEFCDNKLDSSFIPCRNIMFLTIAMNRAVVLGCDTVITGVTAADFVEFGEFSWEWLGGFVDAEGCINLVSVNKPNLFRLSISQADPELFHRLGSWIKKQLPDFTYSIHKSKGINKPCFEMVIAKKATTLIMPYLSPFLLLDKRRKQANKVGLMLQSKAEMTDAYVTGFWEGDGGCYGSYIPQRNDLEKLTRMFEFSFYQNETKILEEISQYLECGYINGSNQKGYTLKISDGPISHKKLDRFRKHFNVMNSFQKITKWRHAIDLLAGGFNPPYPDCTPDFIYTMDKTCKQALLVPGTSPINIETPLMFLTKAESVLLANTIPDCMRALSYSHTSYDGKYPPTGKNHANLLRAHGFEMANIPDPLILRAHKEGLMELPKTANYCNERRTI